MKKILTLIVLLISSYQFLSWLNPSLNTLCHLNTIFNCQAVTSSIFGTILGVPLSWFGILWSCLLLVKPRYDKGTAILYRLGFIVALYSVSVMSLVIHQYCLLCMIIDLCLIGLFSFTIFKKSVDTQLSSWSEIGLSIGLTGLITLSLWSFNYFQNNSQSFNEQTIIGLNSPLTLGNPQGTKKIIVFTDFECPGCKVASQTIHKLLQDPQIVVIVKNFPLSNLCNPEVSHNLHPWSCLAAKLSFCAFEQGKFDEFYNLIYANQENIANHEDLFKTLSFSTLNLPLLKSCSQGDWAESRLQKDLATGAKINLNGTPTFYYQGRIVPDWSNPVLWQDLLSQ